MPIKQVLESSHVPVKIWTDDIEDEAKQQLKNVGALPFVYRHVAAMPDAHHGIGATVGSVIATKGAICPAAVGVDIGCVDAESEYLSPDGWRRVDKYDGGQVMQWDDGVGTFVQPIGYVKRRQASFLHFKTKYGVDQMLTDDHRVLAWEPVGRKRYWSRVVLSAGEIANRHASLKLGWRGVFETAFTSQPDSRLSIDDAHLRVMVMVMADACLDNNTSCVVNFKKSRKISRCKSLLEDAGIKYTTGSGDGTTWFRFVPPLRKKSYDWCWTASEDQLRVIVDEVFLWDGNIKDRAFFTRDKASADFIHYAFAATGSRSTMRADRHPSGGTDYRVFSIKATRTGISGSPRGDVRRVPSKDGFAYCFQVPSSFWVMRRGGNIVVTGNCGMLAVKTILKPEMLDGKLPKLRAEIERGIPVGFSDHNTPLSEADSVTLYEDRPYVASTNEIKKSKHQLGTLGGGNHFVEVCLDDNQGVWLMLHSGSRGIGNKVASKHIELAKGVMKQMFIALPDPDLAYFAQGTEEFRKYMEDLAWCQEYALVNRQLMRGIALRAMAHVAFGDAGHDIVEDPIRGGMDVNVHHNYVEWEHHFGENVMVTRKGAIRARNGDMGIIPGSMGTGSFIVRGRGNPDSFCSAPHGAGRRMSRAKARKTFTVADLEAQTAGVESRKDSDVLDEIPGAYKPIETVIDNSSDLVEVVVKLKQVLCVKG